MKPAKVASEPPPAGLFWPGWIAFALIVVFVNAMNVQAQWRMGGVPGGPLVPVVWEYSSGAASIALYPLVWRLVQWAHWGDGRPMRLIVVHVLGSLGYSLAHVSGFVLLRIVIYALAGGSYRFDWFGSSGFLYEYPRDLIAYGLVAGAQWGLGALLNARIEGLASPAPAPTPGAPTTFDIRDGARTLRVPVSDIAAVSSAGNYVEFSLVDCRKPLMRATLGAMESQLAAAGFVRIHRSWLVNAARVEAIEPAGSGDFTVTLSGGVKAPLSRRFREALEALRG